MLNRKEGLNVRGRLTVRLLDNLTFLTNRCSHVDTLHYHRLFLRVQNEQKHQGVGGTKLKLLFV